MGLVVIGVANREQVLFSHNTFNPLKAREKVTRVKLSLKRWPNGVASRRKLGLLASMIGLALRALVLTCRDLRSLW